MTPQPKTGRRLILWRHGQTAWNVENRAQGQLDVAMDAVGEQQVRDAAPQLAALGPDRIWSSDLQRARLTAQELSELTGIPVRQDRRLREYDVGIRQGLTYDEFRVAHPDVHARFFGDPEYQVPGAEHPEQVISRMAEVMREAAADLAPGQCAVLVGHGAALTSGLLGFFGVSPKLREMFAGMDNCAWAELHEHPARGWQLVAYNQSGAGAAATAGMRDLRGNADATPPAR
ncbi:histidine phosphatase family protein [Naumannella sp. ID2617S]|nr:histidine phosphatase family protein [Naumannella sp. ID2617S]